MLQLPDEFATVGVPRATPSRKSVTDELAAAVPLKTSVLSFVSPSPLAPLSVMIEVIVGAAGAIEALICLLAIQDNVAPPTINYNTPDPECDLDYVPNKARQMPIDASLSNSFGFGGHNVALVMKRV